MVSRIDLRLRLRLKQMGQRGSDVGVLGKARQHSWHRVVMAFQLAKGADTAGNGQKCTNLLLLEVF